MPDISSAATTRSAAIDAALKRYEGRVAITALHGLRGVGKTTLAAAYAERHRGDYRATWWIRAQTESTMRADLVALGVRLGWVAADEKEEPALAAVRERLRHEGEGLLLIYDNAIDAASLKPYLPPGGAARVLVTSNAHAWRGRRRAGRNPAVAEGDRRGLPDRPHGPRRRARRRRGVVQALGGLPLAHEQAAAYCERLDVSLAEYRRRFQAAPARLLDDAKDAPSEYHDGLTVAKTFALAIEEAAKLHPAAEPLIVHAALLAPEPIPLFLFSEAREKFGEPLARQLAGDGLDEAVAALRAFALVDRETIADERDPCDHDRRDPAAPAGAGGRGGAARGEGAEAARRALIEAMAAVYPEDVFNDPEPWPRARRLDALALELVGGRSRSPAAREKRRAHLLNVLAALQAMALAAYPQARPLFERALAIREKVLGPEHPDTATSLNNLAVLLQDQGDLAGARPLYERALAIREKALGPEHPDTATSLNNLARLLQAQGDLAGARPLCERALAIREKALGPEHPDTATSLNNLALLLQAQGDLRRRGRSSSARWRSARRRSAPNIPTPRRASTTSPSCFSPGRSCGRAATPRARAGDPRKGLGPEHPDTAKSLNNLAHLLMAQGDSRRRGRSTSGRWRSAKKRSALSIPTPQRASPTSPACFRTRATSRGRGRSTSARWRSAKRCSALSTPIRPRLAGISPFFLRIRATSTAQRRSARRRRWAKNYPTRCSPGEAPAIFRASEGVGSPRLRCRRDRASVPASVGLADSEAPGVSREVRPRRLSGRARAGRHAPRARAARAIMIRNAPSEASSAMSRRAWAAVCISASSIRGVHYMFLLCSRQRRRFPSPSLLVNSSTKSIVPRRTRIDRPKIALDYRW